MQCGLLVEKHLYCRYDGGKVVEIEMQELELTPRRCALGFDHTYRILGFRLRAPYNVDRGILLEKDLCQLQADATISSGNNENLYRFSLVLTRLSLRAYSMLTFPV